MSTNALSSSPQTILDLSPTNRRTNRSISPIVRQKEAERIHRERRDISRKNQEKLWIPGGEKVLPDHSSGGKVYPIDPSPQKSLKVKDLLSDTRDRSRQRAQEINRERSIHSLVTVPSGER